MSLHGSVYRFFGDSNDNRNVDTSDFGLFRRYFGGINPIFDFYGDGSIDVSDFMQFRQRFWGSLP